MKRFNYLMMSAAILTVTSFCVLSGHAHAGPLLSNHIKLQNGPGSNAGEFRVDDGSFVSLGTGMFNTFCVQRQEFINYDTAYRVVLNNVPVANPNNVNITSGDGLKASALYREFLRGKPTSAAALAGSILGVAYNFNLSGNVANPDADNLQKAIWWYMGQNNAGAQLYTSIANAVANNVYIAAAELANLSNSSLFGGVKVMNLYKGSWNGNGTTWTDDASPNAQDQLYYGASPPGGSGNPVPEPASMALWLTTLVVGACVYRRRQNRV